ncbi:Gfo/Idh/MocA family oxidoreductase [Pseudarthrobacter sp. J1738]|uniref:Gfo/Idh/MocA family oxidoreductase n=1 Tax=unclassified Pseudarthrobacter TaxID=2647000 RepID=UPI003D29A41A
MTRSSEASTPAEQFHTGHIRTAVIGFGLSGSVFHAPLIAANPDFSLDIIATSDVQRAADARRRYPGTVVVRGAAEVLEKADELDLVVLGTPPATHYPLAKAALEAGLDVVVDKPFVVTSAQGEELVALAQRLGRKLTVYQNRRWDNGFLTVKGLLERGELGTVTRFESGMERWQPEITKSWKAAATVADGGGVFYDLGTHLLDIAVQLFGPAAVVHAEIQVRRPQEHADDDVFVVLRHNPVGDAAPVMSHLTMNQLSGQPGPGFRVLGTQGTYLKSGIDPQEAQLQGGMLPSDPGYGIEPAQAHGWLGFPGSLGRVQTERGNYPEFYRLLAKAINANGPVPVDPEGPIEVLRLMEAARRIAEQELS